MAKKETKKESFKGYIAKRFELMHEFEKQSKPLLDNGLSPSFSFQNIQDEHVDTITIYKNQEFGKGPVYFVKHKVWVDDYEELERWILFKYMAIELFGRKFLQNRVEVAQYRSWPEVVDDIVSMAKESKL